MLRIHSRYGYSASDQKALDEIDKKLEELSKFNFEGRALADLDNISIFGRLSPDRGHHEQQNQIESSVISYESGKERMGKRKSGGNDGSSSSRSKKAISVNVNDRQKDQGKAKDGKVRTKKEVTKETANFLAASRLERVRKQVIGIHYVFDKAPIDF